MFIGAALHAQTVGRMPEFNPKGSLKVITLNSDDPFLGILENALIASGFQVVSDNMLYPPSTGGISVVTDSSASIIGRQIMPSQTSDYVIRYQYTFAGNTLYTPLQRRVNYMNIAVVNSKTGRIEANFHYAPEPPVFEAMNLSAMAARFVQFLQNGT